MIRLCQNGQPAAQIVVSPAAAPAEQHAAEELQRFLRQMSGAELPIANAPAKDLPNITIGSAAPEGKLDLSEEALNFDGYVVKTLGGDLVLAGAKPHSSLYAVYHLLERVLGCGFLEEGDQVPHRPTVELADLDIVSRPRFSWRNYFVNMQEAYSGMRWWTWKEFKPWVEYLVKKRFNVLSYGDSIGIVALTAEKLGVHIERTDWQKQRHDLMRKVYDYARLQGIRIPYGISPNVGHGCGVPGFSPYADGPQFTEFLKLYEEKYGRKIATIPLNWCGVQSEVLDPEDPVTKEFLIAMVHAYSEALGTDHHYGMWTPTEENWIEDIEEASRATYASVMEMIKVIKTADPDAQIMSPRVCVDNPTAEAQARAVRDAGLPVGGDMFLNHAGRMHDFLRCDYYWGLPFTTGMCGQCGRETNPNGDIATAIRNAQQLVNNPRAANCFGFIVSSETNHRNVMTMDLYSELSWNPNDVDPDEYPRKWNARRYGDSAEKLWPATKAFSDTIMSYFDNGTHNGPLYRNWDGTQLPGLTSSSVKRLIGYLPQMRFMLETLLSEYDNLKDAEMYRFDLIDIGRTYLAAIFNDRLARARKAMRASDKETFETHAAEVIDVMYFMARYCSSHPQFRLKTHDDWAKRWPPVVPGHDNSETNWITFTALISKEHWQVLLDYMPDDYAEMIEHYFMPRVELYLQKMRELIEAGKDISGRLVDRDSDVDLPSRLADWATPQGFAPWSAYGDTCEPELTAGDEALALKLILAGTPSGRYDFYRGPLDKLVRELLDRYAVPADLDEIMAEKDHAPIADQRVIPGTPGEVCHGFRAPGVVEIATVPKELEDVIEVEELRREYNIARGEIRMYQVTASGLLKLKRLPNEKALKGDHDVAVYEFEHGGQRYVLRYDGGSDFNVAEFNVAKA